MIFYTFPHVIYNTFISDFSPEPSNPRATQALIQQLQAQGMSVKPSSGNES